MMKRCLSILALLSAPAWLCVLSYGEDRESGAAPLQYRRILAPADRMSDWPTGDGKYLPLEAKEFERLLTKLQAVGKSPALPSTQLRRVEYRAALENDRVLVGKAELEILQNSESPVLLPLDPCNLSMRDPQWEAVSEKSSLAKEEGTVSKKALWGVAPQGKLAIVVKKSGKLQLDWSLSGRRDAGGNVLLSGEIPAAATISLVLDLPAELVPQIEEGLVSPPQAMDSPSPDGSQRSMKRWRIELGGHNRFQLKLVSGDHGKSTAELPLLHEMRVYDLSPRGADVSVQWKLQCRGEPLRQLTVLLDPGLELVAVRCGEAAVTWTVEPFADAQGKLAILNLPPSAERNRTLHLSAIAPLVTDRSWRLPRLRAEGAAWEDGQITVSALKPLLFERLQPCECSQTATGPLAAPRIGESAQFRCFTSTATVEAALALPRKNETVAAATGEETGTGTSSSRVAGDLHSGEAPASGTDAAGDTRRPDKALPGNEPPLSSAPVAKPSPSACAWSVLLESWHQPDGIARYAAVWDVERGDRAEARITMPEGVDLSAVTGVWIDEQAASWQPILEINPAGEKANPTGFSVSLPPEKRFATLTVEFAVREKSLSAVGTIAARLPRLDLPLLAADWRMWLPPGYEAVTGQSPGEPLIAPRKTTGQRLWGPLGREADRRRFRIFSAEDWASMGSDPAWRQARENLEKTVLILDQSLERAQAAKKGAAVPWRAIFEPSDERSNWPPLMVDLWALDGLGISGQTALPTLADQATTRRVAELLQKARLTLLVSGEAALLTSQTSAAFYRRQWNSMKNSVTGILSPGPLADRLKAVLSNEKEERFLPARIWAQSPPRPKSPWDRGHLRGAMPVELPGWNAASRELSLREAGSIGYVYRPAFQLAGPVIFIVVAAFGWWFLPRAANKVRVALTDRPAAVRDSALLDKPAVAPADKPALAPGEARRDKPAVAPAGWMTLLFLAAVFALAALLLSEPYAGLASWAMLGIVFCLFLQAVIRKQSTDDAIASRALPSEIKPLLSAVLASTILQAEEGPNGKSNGASDGSSRGSTSGSVAKLLLIAAVLSIASESAAEELPKEAATATTSPVHRVLVPIDAAKKPVGDKVYVSESFYQELYRRAEAVSERPRGWLLTSALYRGSFSRDSVSGQMAIESLQARFDLHAFGRGVRVRLPFPQGSADVLPESVRLDGRPLSVEWETAGTAFTFTINQPGDYRLELSLQPKVHHGGGAGFECSIPRSAAARLELMLPADSPAVEVPSALGRVMHESEPPRIVADLGPADRLAVAWQTGAAGAAVAEIEELLWLKVQPGSVVLDVLLRGNAAAGRLQKLQLTVDPRLRLQPLAGPEAPRVQARTSPEGLQIITLEWPQPLPEQAAVRLSFLLTGASGVGNLRLPRFDVQHLRTGKPWLGISVDSRLEYSFPRAMAAGPEAKAEVEPVAVNDFLKAWGMTPSVPQAAYRLMAAADWSVLTKPREPSIAAEPALALSFGRKQAEIDFAAQLTCDSGDVFQYRLLAPTELAVQTVSLKQDGVERVSRWARGANGALTIFLTGPAEGRQELKLHATMPLSAGPSFVLPVLKIDKAVSEAVLVQVYRRPDVLVEATPPVGAISAEREGEDRTEPNGTLQSSAPIAAQPAPRPAREIGEAKSDLTPRGRLVCAYRVSEKSPSLGTVAVQPNQPIFTAQQLLWLWEEDRQWRAEVDCRVQVARGLVDRLQFDVSPSWIEPFTVSAGATIDAAAAAGPRRRVAVVPSRAIAGEYRFRLGGTLKFEPGERPAMPDVALRQARELARFAALPRTVEGRETNWEARGLKVVQLPAAFAGTIDAKRYDVCEATAKNPRAVLRPEAKNNAAPHVALADIQVAWQSDGTWRGVATFDVLPGGLSNWPLRLPAGCELVSASVEGTPIQPPSPQQGEWHVHFASARLPQRVSVVYRGTMDARDRPGTREFAAPTLGKLPVARTLWTVAGPCGFTTGACQGKEPIDAPQQQWIRFRETSGLIERSAGLFSEDKEETRRWYQIRLRQWANARAALLRQWLPISPTAAGRAMRKEMETLAERQLQTAESLEMAKAFRQLLAAAPQAEEPAEWWSETLFDSAAAARFDLPGRVASLQLQYAWAEKGQTLERFGTAGGILGLLALAIWGIRKEYWNKWRQKAPSMGYLSGGILGVAWWLWLSPSGLGLVIVLASAASWGWSRRNSR